MNNKNERTLVFEPNKLVKNRSKNAAILNKHSAVFASKYKQSIPRVDCGTDLLRSKLLNILHSYPEMKFLLSTEVLTTASNSTLNNLQMLISELLKFMDEADKMNCMVMHVSVLCGSVYISMNHDREGLKQKDLLPNGASKKKQGQISSIASKCRFLHVEIEFDIGSTVIRSKPSWE